MEDAQLETVSSVELAKAAGTKPPQLRRDLGYLGQFGTRGLGYNVSNLARVINGALGRTRLQPVVLAGVGNLGAALLCYGGFRKEGFEIIAAFDLFPELARARFPESSTAPPILHANRMASYIADHEVKMAIMAVPAESGQTVADVLVEAGIQAILNFSPVVLKVPENVMVRHMDLAVELENLSFFIR